MPTTIISDADIDSLSLVWYLARIVYPASVPQLTPIQGANFAYPATAYDDPEAFCSQPKRSAKVIRVTVLAAVLAARDSGCGTPSGPTVILRRCAGDGAERGSAVIAGRGRATVHDPGQAVVDHR